MKKNCDFSRKLLVNIILLSSSAVAFNVNAALVSSSTLLFDAGVSSCLLGAGTFPNCSYGSTVTSGSYIGFDTNASGTITSPELAALNATQGIKLGSIQNAGEIDAQWEHITGFGQHFTSTAINILSDNGSGNVTLDFSGWNMNWAYKDTSLGVETYSLGGGNPSFPNETGIATLTCALDCSNGDRFVLSYLTHTLSYSAEGNKLPSTQYELYLEGTISAVPLPASLWLFASGLLALVGFRKNTFREKENLTTMG